MSSAEIPSSNADDLKLREILERYGDEPVRSHKDGGLMPLSQAVDECPPFKDALLRAANPEQLQQVVNALKV